MVTLAIVALAEAAAVVTLAGMLAWRERQHVRELGALLDRLMSRNYQDYAVAKTIDARAPRRRSVTDADEARIEEARRQAVNHG
jgi:hypothetical protein